ncbi:unnamed protein product [Gordionus sp. m RMFG-2023]|uniref:DNA methyltransferase 1-associated protein 1-like isoform X2 n=1 Tax=Gordionus sp. m RMFG-2023 TaxID=3053472 RepID=UPI0030E253AC
MQADLDDKNNEAKTNGILSNAKSEKNIKPRRIFKKPEGMHRELYSLIRNDNKEPPPFIITDLTPTKYMTNKIYVNKHKKVRKWLWTSFNHSERKDNLKLFHWQREQDIDTGKPYPFAKFNKSPDVPVFTNEEYDKFLVSESWTQKETNYLIYLAKQFNINFIVMNDRWDRNIYGDKHNSIEDLKKRYHDIYNALAKARAPIGIEPNLWLFDAAYEMKRKTQLNNLWNRTPEQIEEEQYLIQKLKKIETRKKDREKKIQDLQKIISIADSNLIAQRCKKYLTETQALDEVNKMAVSPNKQYFGEEIIRDSSNLNEINIKLEELSNSSSLNYNHLDVSSEETGSNFSFNQPPINPHTPNNPNKRFKNSPSFKNVRGSNQTQISRLSSSQNAMFNKYGSFQTGSMSTNIGQSTSRVSSKQRHHNRASAFHHYQQAMFDQANFSGIKFPDYKSSGVFLRSNKMKLPISLGQKKTKAIEQALVELLGGGESGIKPPPSNPNPLENSQDPNKNYEKDGREEKEKEVINRNAVSYYNHPYHPPANESVVLAFNNLRTDIILLYELKGALTATQHEIQYLKMYRDEISQANFNSQDALNDDGSVNDDISFNATTTTHEQQETNVSQHDESMDFTTANNFIDISAQRIKMEYKELTSIPSSTNFAGNEPNDLHLIKEEK